MQAKTHTALVTNAMIPTELRNIFFLQFLMKQSLQSPHPCTSLNSECIANNQKKIMKSVFMYHKIYNSRIQDTVTHPFPAIISFFFVLLLFFLLICLVSLLGWTLSTTIVDHTCVSLCKALHDQSILPRKTKLMFLNPIFLAYPKRL